MLRRVRNCRCYYYYYYCNYTHSRPISITFLLLQYLNTRCVIVCGLCDLICQVTLRSSDVSYHEELCTLFINFFAILIYRGHTTLVSSTTLVSRLN